MSHYVGRRSALYPPCTPERLGRTVLRPTMHVLVIKRHSSNETNANRVRIGVVAAAALERIACQSYGFYLTAISCKIPIYWPLRGLIANKCSVQLVE